jgi:LacI family transcriptional regulator
LISANLHPELTTMQLPHYEMGKWAVEAVLQISQGMGEKGPAPQVTLPCPLVLRDSV